MLQCKARGQPCDLLQWILDTSGSFYLAERKRWPLLDRHIRKNTCIWRPQQGFWQIELAATKQKIMRTSTYTVNVFVWVEQFLFGLNSSWACSSWHIDFIICCANYLFYSHVLFTFILVYFGIFCLFSTLVNCGCFKCAIKINFDLTVDLRTANPLGMVKTNYNLFN